MPKFTGNASVELHFDIEAEKEEDCYQVFIAALRSMQAEHYKRVDQDIHYFGVEEIPMP